MRSVADGARRAINPRATGSRLSAILALPLLLAACLGNPQSGGTPSTGVANAGATGALTPAQAQLRQINSDWNSTVATGVLAGAALGTIIGIMADPRNATRAGVTGAVAGGVGGGLFGAQVATRNYGFAQRNLSLQQRLDSANATASTLEQQSQAARQTVEENRRELASLTRQVRARQITAAEYNQRVQAMQQDVAAMREGAQNGEDARKQLNLVSGDSPQLRAAEDRIRPAQRRLEASANELEELLRQAPPV